jgi:hypothetical protein
VSLSGKRSLTQQSARPFDPSEHLPGLPDPAIWQKYFIPSIPHHSYDSATFPERICHNLLTFSPLSVSWSHTVPITGRVNRMEGEAMRHWHYYAQPADAVVGYSYRADQYCPECLNREITPAGHNQVIGSSVEEMLDRLAEAAGIDRENEWSFDSGDFPKVILSYQVEGDPDTDRCGRCGELVA